MPHTFRIFASGTVKDRGSAIGCRQDCRQATMATEQNHGTKVTRTGIRLISCFFPLVAGAACQTLADNNDVPAVITDPSAESRTALKSAIADSLNTDVIIADDALTKTSVLIIERNPPRTMQGQPAQGRIMDPPIRFQLVVNDAECILIDTRDAKRYLLENTTCVAE